MLLNVYLVKKNLAEVGFQLTKKKKNGTNLVMTNKCTCVRFDHTSSVYYCMEVKPYFV